MRGICISKLGLKPELAYPMQLYDHIVRTAEPLLMGYVFREELQHRTNS